MSRSSVDIGNPCYSPSEQEVKYSSGILEDVLEGYSVKASYDFYLHERQIRIVSLVVETNYDGLYLDEIVVELIGLQEGKTALLETTMTII